MRVLGTLLAAAAALAGAAAAAVWLGKSRNRGIKHLASRRMPADKDAQSFTVFRIIFNNQNSQIHLLILSL